MTPRTAAAMQAALQARLVDQARVGGLEPGRLRRRLVFQRLLRRLSDDDRWVLKGGYLLEARLPGNARTTRDLDLAGAEVGDADAARSALDRSLSGDPDSDFFRFSITQASPLGVDRAGRGGWRFSLTATLDSRVFDRVRLDVVERVAESFGGTEIIELSSPVSGVEFTPARVTAVDVAQHAAEKYHALCRTYAGDRPSTRVKDLVDLVLLAEAGLLPDPRLRARLRAVFASRDGTEHPPDLPDPPSAWERDYASLTAQTPTVTPDVAAAVVLVSGLYRTALT